MSQNNEQVMRMALEALRPFYQDALRIHPDWADERRRSSLTQEKPILVSDFRKVVSAFLEIELALAAQAASLSKTDECDAQACLSLTRGSQAEQAGQSEPVAWIRGSGLEMLKLENGGCATVFASEGMSNFSRPLYTHPAPVRQPLTQTEIGRISRESQILYCLGKIGSFEEAFARNLEAAHGITAQGAAHD